MKNGHVVTAYLDYAEESRRLFRAADTAEKIDALEERDEQSSALWQACLDAGWTIAELDAAYERRLGFRVRR